MERKSWVLLLLLFTFGITLIIVGCSSGGSKQETVTYDYKIELYSGGVLIKTHNYKDAEVRIFNNWVKITLHDDNVIFLHGDMEVNRTTVIKKKKTKSNNIDY